MEVLSIQGLKDLYNETMAQADQRSSTYPLMETPHTFFALVALYLFISVKGPKWMENRKPLNLQTVIVVYNFLMVLLSSYMCSNAFFGILRKGGYSVKCETMEGYYTTDWLNLGWLFVVSKLVEFLDTFLFILVKKNSHVTFLHVYHHSVMASFTWLGYKFLPGGTNTIYVLLNSFVHTIMYTYYALAAMGPGVRKYLWWKRYLTIVQISQFVIYIAQGVVNTYYSCPTPKPFKYAVALFTVTILLLFLNFYLRAYIVSKSHPSPTVSQNGTKKKVH